LGAPFLLHSPPLPPTAYRPYRAQPRAPNPARAFRGWTNRACRRYIRGRLLGQSRTPGARNGPRGDAAGCCCRHLPAGRPGLFQERRIPGTALPGARLLPNKKASGEKGRERVAGARSLCPDPRAKESDPRRTGRWIIKSWVRNRPPESEDTHPGIRAEPWPARRGGCTCRALRSRSRTSRSRRRPC
jgi:hypothetical protein